MNRLSKGLHTNKRYSKNEHTGAAPARKMGVGQIEQRMKAVLNKRKFAGKVKKSARQRSRDTGGQLKQCYELGMRSKHKSADNFKMKGESDYPVVQERGAESEESEGGEEGGCP